MVTAVAEGVFNQIIQHPFEGDFTQWNIRQWIELQVNGLTVFRGRIKLLIGITGIG